MKNTNFLKYSIFSLAGLFAVLAIVFVASSLTAHAYGCYSGYGGCYDYGHYYGGSGLVLGTNNNYNNYNNYSPLQVSCYPTPTTAVVGQSVTWYATVSGGAGNYTFAWSGDEGLTSYTSSAIKSYAYAGNKYATVSVTSNGQTVSQACGYSVNVSSNYNYYPYQNNYYNYSAISGSCTANTTYTTAGTPVTWTLSVIGGNGYYTYNWGGTDGLYGNTSNVTTTYYTPGSKTAYVTVTSNGQTSTLYCNNSVNVGGQYGTYGTTGYMYNTGYVNPTLNSNSNGLDVGCYADPTSVAINQPVTWNVEVTGGVAPYTYSWTGSDNLSGTNSSVIKYYGTAGTKNAIVTVTSADGRNTTRACTTALTVRSAYTGGSTNGNNANTGNNSNTTGANNNAGNTNTTNTSNSTTTSATNNNGLAAASIFSLGNIPWGWIAILIILVLFFTVLYLLFNRQKI